LKKTFRSGKTRKYDFRLKQLKQLLRGIVEMRQELLEAIEKDLQMGSGAAFFGHVWGVEEECRDAVKHLKAWMKHEDRDTSLLLAPAVSQVQHEPFGVALIFGSWNYPYVVGLGPLVGAIAAGNCAVLKPSEISPASSDAMEKLFKKYLDPSCYRVLQGGVEVAIQITQKKWDIICFTGSTDKGKLVAAAAAKHLVPCILELGGKCPMIVDRSADIQFAAFRAAFGRFYNSGQTCLATDYILVHHDVIERFKVAFLKEIKKMYSETPKTNKDMGKIISDWHCDRLKDLIETSGGKVLLGGEVDKSKNYVAPTVIEEPKADSQIMREEIFGPLVPIMAFKTIDEVIDRISDMDKPLAIYYFGSRYFNPTIERIRNETSSGAFLVNEVIMHMVNSFLPFGGVGASGYGKYHGVDGFKAFSNNKAIMLKPTMNIYPYNTIAPPFTRGKEALLAVLFKIPGTQNQLKCLLKWIFILVVIGCLMCCFQQQLYGGLQGAMGLKQGQCPFATMAKQLGAKNPHAPGHAGADL